MCVTGVFRQKRLFHIYELKSSFVNLASQWVGAGKDRFSSIILYFCTLNNGMFTVLYCPLSFQHSMCCNSILWLFYTVFAYLFFHLSSQFCVVAENYLAQWFSAGLPNIVLFTFYYHANMNKNLHNNNNPINNYYYYLYIYIYTHYIHTHTHTPMSGRNSKSAVLFIW